MKKQYLILFLAAALIALLPACNKGDVYKTLIVTGQGDHNWEASSSVLKTILDEAGMFSTEIVTTPANGGDMSAFKPKFSKYRLVVLDYNGDSWPEETKTAFVEYVKNGGGVVVYHTASSAFPEWKEYNQITGLGGFNGRDKSSGPYVYYGRDGLVVDDTASGPAGTMAEQRDFEVRIQITDHPVTEGLPVRWMQASDVLLQNLRGPAENMQILATAMPRMMMGRGRGQGGTRPPIKYDPVLMTIEYGRGRIFHTVLGHAEEGGGPAMQSVGFIVTLQRGAEWAASGSVTQEVPFDFPTAAAPVLRTDFKEITLDVALANLPVYDIEKSTKYMVFIQNQIAKTAGDEKTLLDIEKKLVTILNNSEATAESKKLILRELSWMGTDYCIPAIEALSSVPELQEAVDFALARLQ